MNHLKEQIKLYKQRSLIHTKIQPLRFTRHARQYIKGAIRKNKKSITILFLFVLGISSIEILVPLFLNSTLNTFSANLEVQSMYWFSLVAICILIAYVYLAYRTISHQKKLSLDIINTIREEWVNYYLQKKPFSLRDSDKGNIFVKVSYHLSLLQLGLNNSLFVFFQWMFFLSGILIVTSILDTRLFLLSLAFIPLNLFVMGIAYLLSSYYLSKDQTLYSKILRFISDTFQSFDLVKAQKREQNIIRRLRSMVDIDNYFRIKREVTLRLGNHIIFATLAFISIALYLISLYQPLLLTESTLRSVTQVLIYGLHLKLIYLSLRVGLFYFPLKLGLYLCIPPQTREQKRKTTSIDSLVIKSQKVSLSLTEKEYQSITLSFKKGKTYHIIYPHHWYNMAHLCAGLRTSHTQPWTVVLNTKRMSYTHFTQQSVAISYIHSYRYSRESLFEYLQGDIRNDILETYDVFRDIKHLHSGHQLHEQNVNDIHMVLIQIAYAMTIKSDVIVIDAVVYDLGYPDIDTALTALRKECPQSIIIICSHTESISTPYDVTYNFYSQ